MIEFIVQKKCKQRFSFSFELIVENLRAPQGLTYVSEDILYLCRLHIRTFFLLLFCISNSEKSKQGLFEMGIVRESESIGPGDAHLFCHVQGEEATSSISRSEDLWLQSDA